MEHAHTAVAQFSSDARIEVLITEIRRYLNAVDTFRELGHEPLWRPEGLSPVAARITAWLDARESQMNGARELRFPAPPP